MEIKKRGIGVYKDAHPKATCSDIAAHFAKDWDVTVGRTTVGDILRSKEKWMSHERSGRAAKYSKLEEAIMLLFNDIRSRGAPVTDAMLVDKAQKLYWLRRSDKSTCLPD